MYTLCVSVQDDQYSMDFVAAAANLRAIVFCIPRKSRFDIKCECWQILLIGACVRMD